MFRTASINFTDVSTSKKGQNLSQTFFPGSVQEFCTFASKTIVERTSVATRQSVKQDVYMCHVYVRADNLSAVLIADHEYPGEKRCS